MKLHIVVVAAVISISNAFSFFDLSEWFMYKVLIYYLCIENPQTFGLNDHLYFSSNTQNGILISSKMDDE